MTTRYGFEGGDPKTGTPAEKPNVVKTVFGREAHLPALKGRNSEAVSLNQPKPAADASRTNQPTVMAGSSQSSTQGVVPSGGLQAKAGPQGTGKGAGSSSSAPSASSKSARPGVARFLGRRNTAGNIVPLTQTEIQLPTAAWLRPVLTVGVAAAGSFLVVAALLWIAGPKAPPPLQTHKAPLASPKLPTTQLVAPAPAAVPVTPPTTPAEPPAKRSAAAPRSTVKHRAKWAAPKPKKPLDPDAPLPPTFF